MNGAALSTFGRAVPEQYVRLAEEIANADFFAYSLDESLIRELKRYFLIRAVLNRPVTMESEAVDHLWHQFILDTRRYREFCQRVFGGYLDHVSSHFDPDPDFRRLYLEMFGDGIPDVWNARQRRTDNCA